MTTREHANKLLAKGFFRDEKQYVETYNKIMQVNSALSLRLTVFLDMEGVNFCEVRLCDSESPTYSLWLGDSTGKTVTTSSDEPIEALLEKAHRVAENALADMSRAVNMLFT